MSDILFKLEQLSFFNEAEKYGRKEDPEPSFESATAKTPKKPKEKGKSKSKTEEL